MTELLPKPTTTVVDDDAATAAQADRRAFQLRCCLQLSPPLDSFANNLVSTIGSLPAKSSSSAGGFFAFIPIGEISYALEFVLLHAAKRPPKEVGRALFLRLIESSSTLDILGAWGLIAAVLAHPQTAGPLVTWLADNIHPVIRQRWMATIEASAGLENSGDTTAASRKVMLNCHPQTHAPLIDPAVAAAYRWLAAGWRDLLTNLQHEKIKRAIRLVERNGNLPNQALIDTELRDALWKLKRTGGPRPQHALDVMKICGFDSPAAIPATEKLLLEKTGPLHSRMREWLMRLKNTAFCVPCDTWDHTEMKCPCLKPIIQDAATNGPVKEVVGDQGPPRRRQDLFDLLSLDAALSILRRFQLSVPAKTEQILDRVLEHIRKRLPYDQLLDALDVTCCVRSGEDERHALWIVSSYNLSLSNSVFSPDWRDFSDQEHERGHGVAAGKGPLEKLRKFFADQRRFREYDLLLAALKLLRRTYAQWSLTREQADARQVIKDERSFFFCFFTNKQISVDFPLRTVEPKAAKAIEKLAPLHQRLCQVCLKLHGDQRDMKICPNDSRDAPRESWDLWVSKQVLEPLGLHDIRSDDISKVGQEVLNIEQDESLAAPERECRKSRIEVAIALTQKAKVPYCRTCQKFGHMGKRCEKNCAKTLQRYNLHPATVKLKPFLIDDRIRDEAEKKTEQSTEEEIKEIDRNVKRLTDAKDALLGKGRGFDPQVQTSIAYFQRHNVLLSFCRYAPDDVKTAMVAVGKGGFVHMLDPFRHLPDGDFPHVCICCGSLEHKSHECKTNRDFSDDIEDFVNELSDRAGSSLHRFCIGKVDVSLLTSRSLRGRLKVEELLQHMRKGCRNWVRTQLRGPELQAQQNTATLNGSNRRSPSPPDGGRGAKKLRIEATSALENTQTGLGPRKLSRLVLPSEEASDDRRRRPETPPLPPRRSNSRSRRRDSRSGSRSRSPRRDARSGSRSRSPRRDARSGSRSRSPRRDARSGSRSPRRDACPRSPRRDARSCPRSPRRRDVRSRSRSGDPTKRLTDERARSRSRSESQRDNRKKQRTERSRSKEYQIEGEPHVHTERRESEGD